MKRENISIARILRKNQTEAEKKLWEVLRNRQLNGIKFRRQFTVGIYILDFYAPDYKLGVEADGGQHYESVGNKRDKLREEFLLKNGIRILRFSNLDILGNIDGVYEMILKAALVIQKTPHLNPLPKGERKLLVSSL